MSDIPRLRPTISPEQGLRIAKRRYDISATEAHPLPSDRDQNLLLIDKEADRRYVLKIAHSGERPEVLDFQNRILETLTRAGFPSSSPLFARDGREVVEAPGPEGVVFLTRLLPWLPGEPLHQVNPLTPGLLQSLGSFLGGMDRVLEEFSHPAQDRDLDWNLLKAGPVLEAHAKWVGDPNRRGLLEEMADRFLNRLEPLTSHLRRSVIHGDANDHNVLVAELKPGEGPEHRKMAGILDFGDAVRSFTAAEPAIACAYAMLDRRDPFGTASHLVAGYHRVFPLSEAEIAAIGPLLGLRLCVSVAMSARQKSKEPDNEYLTVSERPAWQLLERLRGESLELLQVRLRAACDVNPVPNSAPVVEWLSEQGSGAAPVIRFPPSATSAEGPPSSLPLSHLPLHILDLSVESTEFPLPPEALDAQGWTDRIFRRMKETGAAIGVGRYDEVRTWYTSAIFRDGEDQASEARTVHMGIDLFVDAGSDVCSPFHAVVHSVTENTGDLDYGPTVILEHRVETEADGPRRFWTLFGHLSREVLASLTAGATVARGEAFAKVGSFPTNGNWAPHLHFQIITDLVGFTGNFPGVALPSQLEIWKALSPDPNLVLRIPDPGSVDRAPGRARGSGAEKSSPGNPWGGERSVPGKPSGAALRPSAGLSRQDLLEVRRSRLGPNLSVSYKSPLKIVRGQAQFLFDEAGQSFLDCVNNVPHVGHSHPRVVEAGQAQMALLNTNTRYLHDRLAEYAERLVAKLPDPLSVVYFVCTGSEANELALRMARIHTGRKDVVVLEGAYHGNTSALVDLSPYKFRGAGGGGEKDWVHPALMPDPYRGLFRTLEGDGDGPGDGVEDSGKKGGNRRGSRSDQPRYLPTEVLGHAYAEDIAFRIEEMARTTGRAPAAFFCETLLGCGGQIVPPPGYLSHAYEIVRKAGGVCVADEVQVGFGRVGSHFWAFETQGVVPDIVTLGKPMGNGHPMAAVVTTPDIADSFHNGMEYFNTFGGNPVSCAIGMAVLEVIEEEGLQENARVVGTDLLQGLGSLKDHHPLVGEVRGRGLFIGVELVEDPEARTPAPAKASRIKERLRDHRILVSTDGPDDNVLKIKPPLVFSLEDGRRLVATLDRVLREDGIRR